MLKQLVFFFIAFSCSLSYGQIGGRYTYQFLNLTTSPRQAALGGKSITIYDEDVNQVMFNPATLNADMDKQLAMNYGSLYGEVSYGTASYAYTYDRHLQTFHAGMSYVNYGSFEGYDENGLATSNFTGSEAALSFGYAYNIPFTDLHVGANAKLITSTLETYSSFGGAIDLGFLFVDERNDVNWALVIRNIGTQFTTYSGIQEKLPLEIIAGVSQELEHVPIRWHLSLENLQQWNISFSNPVRGETNIDGSTNEEKVSFVNNALRHVIVGVELFPKKAFNIRLGYNFRRAEELKIAEQRNFSGISLGFGLKMNRLKFNYSYSRYTLAANSSLFGLILNLQ
ncbi:type IX secretion system protein PorQ [Flavobacterium sp. Fl-77]|uniref:Type IX secretion system protein PorQ n=1 Tax=Flavobacterium flavipigmentatum TaxID=2893884 RepID=A0AAJ2S802_9FLAO|nr:MULTISPECIES: type IX secretion system protein PorQ [unclassified Flavobacterium]MDX6182820.1 type IX secretion system protein PorQ [Flavobacterium sp. Fl-33]MDX6186273.1 type IX secretion system protein PorQ [Flavobacterium sp. Fl-77]UFH37938.1 type IX secretion system protein PorQ [Flavobacterium sp. F-70]